MLTSGALASIMPAYGALPPSSQQDRSKRIGFEVGRYANVMASKGFGSKLSIGPDELPELRLPIVTWDQPPILYAGGVTVWMRDDPIIRHVGPATGQYQDERTYRAMRTTVAPVQNSINALNAQLLGVGYSLQTPRQRRSMPAAKALKDELTAMFKRLDNLHAYLEIASTVVWDGWMPTQTWWSSYAYNGKSVWGPDKIFEMPQELFGVTPDRKLAWLGYTMTQTMPEVLDSEEDEMMTWLWTSSGSTRSPYGTARLRHLYVIGWAWKQAFQWHMEGARNALQGIPVVTEEVPVFGGMPGSAERASQVGEAGTAAMKEAMKEAQGMMQMLKEYGILILRAGYKYNNMTTAGFEAGWGKLLDDLALMLTVGVQGQHLTQSLGEHGGSRATADVQERTKVDHVRGIARPEELVPNELIRRYLAVNYSTEPDPDDVPVWGFHLLDPVDIAKSAFFCQFGGKLDAQEMAARLGDLPISIEEETAGPVLEMQGPPPSLAGEGGKNAAPPEERVKKVGDPTDQGKESVD